jgi:hypothetical protein
MHSFIRKVLYNTICERKKLSVLTNYATGQEHTDGPTQVPPGLSKTCSWPRAPHTCAPSKVTHTSSHAHKQALTVAAREGLVHMGL